MGVTEPEATFSACYGGAFLMWHPMKYAAMLAERMRAHGTQAWLVNTGEAAIESREARQGQAAGGGRAERGGGGAGAEMQGCGWLLVVNSLPCWAPPDDL